MSAPRAGSRPDGSEIVTDRKTDSFAFAGDHEKRTEAETFATFDPTLEGA
ncbi:hypothetical protein [Tropicimonas sp. IMCC34011]|nr:hypothetical protein [Tropicimonas sp. IMCC34011]